MGSDDGASRAWLAQPSAVVAPGSTSGGSRHPARHRFGVLVAASPQL
jgi:hypothetical protein